MNPQRFQGTGVSRGIALGRVFLLHAEPLPVVPRPVPPERVEEEVARFERAVGAAGLELEEIKGQVLRALGGPYAAILEAQRLILDDPDLLGQTVQRIRVGRVSARWALKEVVAEVTRKFDAIDDEYIRERAGELSDVQRRLQRLLRGEAPQRQELPEGPLVVVAHAVGPSDTMVLTRERVIGLATDVGGPTSHTAILAQALELPAVVGLHDVSRRVRAGDSIILDGETGEVELFPEPADTARAEVRRKARIVTESEMLSTRDLPAVTRDGKAIRVRANIEFPSEVDSVERFGAQGIGLYRSEFLFLSRTPEFPDEEEHYRTYREIASRVAPHPAVVRTLDLGGEKYFHEVLDRHEPNPVLGLRGVRLCLKRPDIFRPQLRGLLRAAGECDNLRMMLPLVTSVTEIEQIRDLVTRETRTLEAEGLAVRPDLPLGVMIEVPAAALAAEFLARHAEFLSIGTNDLIQYALAIDRGNESLTELYQPEHPGVLRMLERIVQAGAARGIPVSICGEMAADPGSIALLIGLGLREFSVQPRAVGAVRQAVRLVDSSEAARLARKMLGGSEAPDGLVETPFPEGIDCI